MNDALQGLGNFSSNMEEELKSKTTTVDFEGVKVTVDWTFTVKSVEFDIEKIDFNAMVKEEADGEVDASGVNMFEILVKNAYNQALSKAKEEVQAYTMQKMQQNPDILKTLQSALGGQQ